VHDLCTRESIRAVSSVGERRRQGSLRSLNQLAAAVAMRMLEELVTEAISTTTWAHLQYDVNGRFAVWYPEAPTAVESCALCARAGLGDEGFT
jgi:hypothetical protein